MHRLVGRAEHVFRLRAALRSECTPTLALAWISPLDGERPVERVHTATLMYENLSSRGGARRGGQERIG